jgi:RNA polymerase sigma-70 factor (ECF subfamily)
MEALAISASVNEKPDREQFVVRRAQRGDLDAFESLYRSHVGRVHGLCLRMVADPSLAEDLTQETFIRAWRHIRTYRGESRFGGWMRRLAVNVVLADRRTRLRRSAFERDDIDPGDLGSPASAEVPDRRRDLESAIAGLPPGARTVFVLHDIEGYRHEEIAAFTGTTSGTSKAQLHRARRLLREALKS